MSETGAKMPGREPATPLPKRFYTHVTTQERDAEFVILLDDRPVRTPGKHLLALPTAALAGLVAAEWDAQVEKIDPKTMPLTRLLNTALELVRGKETAVAEDIVKFSSSDLLCYRADTSVGLLERQEAAWDPILEWAATALGAKFEVSSGIMPVQQSEKSLSAITVRLEGYDALALSAMHQLTTLSGSALLALAVALEHLSVEQAWAAAHVDEDWQIEHWGEDGEAKARRVARRQDFDAAWAVLANVG